MWFLKVFAPAKTVFAHLSKREIKQIKGNIAGVFSGNTSLPFVKIFWQNFPDWPKRNRGYQI